VSYSRPLAFIRGWFVCKENRIFQSAHNGFNGLCFAGGRMKTVGMNTVIEVERHALRLPEKQRARLAARILDSLAAHGADDDEGEAEALRRAGELDAGTGLSPDELDGKIRARRLA
jgi:putative addiction module component (TIGR02574 family)